MDIPWSWLFVLSDGSPVSLESLLAFWQQDVFGPVRGFLPQTWNQLLFPRSLGLVYSNMVLETKTWGLGMQTLWCHRSTGGNAGWQNRKIIFYLKTKTIINLCKYFKLNYNFTKPFLILISKSFNFLLFSENTSSSLWHITSFYQILCTLL